MEQEMVAKDQINQKSASLILASIIFIVLVLDQVSKYWVSYSLQLGESYPIFSWLNVNLQHNSGAAFSFLSDFDGWQVYLLAIVAVLVCVVMVFWLFIQAQRSKWQVIVIGLIVGGAIGNLIDRIRFGYVIDFIDFHIGEWHYATFNIADSAISIGVALLILLLIVQKNR